MGFVGISGFGRRVEGCRGFILGFIGLIVI